MSEHAIANAKAWLETIRELAARMSMENTEDESDRKAAREEAQESALSVQVREGWRTPGAPSDEGPEEFEILLTTGGPALRIWGKLDAYSEPETCELQWQDWFTPWTRYTLEEADEAAVHAFVGCFYFGEG